MSTVNCVSCGDESPEFDPDRVGQWFPGGTLPWLPRGWEWSAARRDADPWCPSCIAQLITDTLDALCRAARGGGW